MLASIMLLSGLFLLIVGTAGILRAAFQVGNAWGFFSLLGLPMVLFSLLYFLRVRFSLMVISLAIAAIGASIIGGADKSLGLRPLADSLGVSHYPLVNMLRYPDDVREYVPYANIESDNEAWPPQVQKETLDQKGISYFSIAPLDMGNYLGRYVIARTFSGEMVTGFIEKIEGNKVTLRAEELNSRASFTYNSELFETVKVAATP